MVSDHELSGDHGDQLALDGLGPRAGDVWENNETGLRATVVTAAQRRHLWLTIRYRDSEREIRYGDLVKFFTPV